MALRDRQGRLRKTPTGFMQQIVDTLNLRKMFDTADLRDRLKRAGLRGQAPLVAFMFFRVAAPAIVFIAAMFYLFVLNGLDYPPLIKLLMALGAAFLGSYCPNIFIENLIQKRAAVDQARVSRCARHAADLRAVGHVGRGGVRQGVEGSCHASPWSLPRN